MPSVSGFAELIKKARGVHQNAPRFPLSPTIRDDAHIVPYYASLGRKTRKQYTDPYAWDQKTVAGILVNQQYTGCTVNFMTTTVSYKVHKTVYKPKDEWQIIPNAQPAIIDEDTWKRVQELREHRIRPTATGRTSLFSGKVFCADCGSKLHFRAAKMLTVYCGQGSRKDVRM